jgi:hypothetical protein
MKDANNGQSIRLNLPDDMHQKLQTAMGLLEELQEQLEGSAGQPATASDEALLQQVLGKYLTRGNYDMTVGELSQSVPDICSWCQCSAPLPVVGRKLLPRVMR